MLKVTVIYSLLEMDKDDDRDQIILNLTYCTEHYEFIETIENQVCEECTSDICDSCKYYKLLKELKDFIKED